MFGSRIEMFSMGRILIFEHNENSGHTAEFLDEERPRIFTSSI